MRKRYVSEAGELTDMHMAKLKSMGKDPADALNKPAKKKQKTDPITAEPITT